MEYPPQIFSSVIHHGVLALTLPPKAGTSQSIHSCTQCHYIQTPRPTEGMAPRHVSMRVSRYHQQKPPAFRYLWFVGNFCKGSWAGGLICNKTEIILNTCVNHLSKETISSTAYMNHAMYFQALLINCTFESLNSKTQADASDKQSPILGITVHRSYLNFWFARTC